MNGVSRYLLIVLLVIFTGCAPESDITTLAPPLDISVSLQKTPCYGSCPSYIFQALNDGRATLRVDRFAEDVIGQNLAQGDYIGTVENNDIENIIKFAHEAKYFKLQNKYDDPMVMDLPASITTIDGHTVFNRFQGPDLEDLYTLIEQTISKIDWHTQIHDK
jgi:hypothetical protein